MNNPTHTQMCKKIAQLTKVVHRLNVASQMHQIDLEKRDKLHAGEISYMSRDFQYKFDSIRSDLQKKDNFVEEIVQDKERIQVERAKEKNEYKAMLEEAMVSKREVELNHYSDIEKSSLAFEQKMDEMHCQYKEKECTLISQMMERQRMLERDAEEKKQLLRNLTKRQKEELDRITSEASCERQSTEVALKEQYESKLRSEKITFESLLAHKEFHEQQLKDCIQNLHDDMKDNEYQSEKIFRKRNQDLSKENSLLSSQVDGLKQDLLESDKDKKELAAAKVKTEQDTTIISKLKVDVDTLVNRNSELHSAELKMKYALMESHTNSMTQSLILVELRNYVNDSKRKQISLDLSLEGWRTIAADLRMLNDALKKDFVTKMKEAGREILVVKDETSQQIAKSVKGTRRLILEVQTEHGLQMKKLKERYCKESRESADKANQTLQDAIYRHQAETEQLKMEITVLDRKSCDVKEKADCEISLLKNQIKNIGNEAALEQKAEECRRRECNKQLREVVEIERVEHKEREVELRSSHCKEVEERTKALLVEHETQICLLINRYEGSYEALSRDDEEYKRKAEQRFLDFQRSSELLQSEIAIEKKRNADDAQEFHLCKKNLNIQVTHMEAEISLIRTTNNDVEAQVGWLNEKIAKVESGKERVVVECHELQSELKLAQEVREQMINRQSADINDVKSRHQIELSLLEESLREKEEKWNTRKLEFCSRLLNAEIYAKDLESNNKNITTNIQCLQHGLNEASSKYEKMKEDMEAMLVDTKKKEGMSKQSMKLFYETEIANLAVQLQKSRAKLDRCQDALSSKRDPADVNTIKGLAEQLVTCKESVEKATERMEYFKNELKNREVNFNSRFADTNRQTIGVMPTFKRRGLQRPNRRHTKSQPVFPKIS